MSVKAPRHECFLQACALPSWPAEPWGSPYSYAPTPLPVDLPIQLRRRIDQKLQPCSEFPSSLSVTEQRSPATTGNGAPTPDEVHVMNAVAPPPQGTGAFQAEPTGITMAMLVIVVGQTLCSW